MPIPNADVAFVQQEKLVEYLLNDNHPIGASKAKWFKSLGYDAATLEFDLLKLVQQSDDFTKRESPFGTKYEVTGRVTTPAGIEVNVTTVWIVETDDNRPRLVTAYPGEKS